LSFSIDAASAKTYKRIKGKDYLDQLEEIVRYTFNKKSSLKKDLPLIRATFYPNPENTREKSLFLEKFQSYVDFIDFQSFHNLRGPKAAKFKNDCRAPFQRLAIFPNGDVSACCTFFSKRLIIGNANQQSLLEIWNSPAVDVIRKGLITGKPEKTCQECLETLSH